MQFSIKNLSPKKQLCFCFVLNWVIWFLGSLLTDKVFYAENHSLSHHIFNATCMALFMTILFGWKQIKALFSRNKATL